MRLKIQSIVATILAMGLLICPARAASAFPDVNENAEYAEAVEYLNEIGIMQGDDKGNFNPYKTVTRAEMAAIICRMLGETGNLTSSTAFTDVPVGHWANGYVGKAAELGIVNGYGDGRFGPSDTVTYEQAVTMIVRALGYENEASSAGGYPDGYLSIAQSIGLLNGVYAQNDALLLNGVYAQNGTFLERKSVAIIVYNSYHSYV